MDAKRLLIGALVGGITMYLVGYLIWALVFADFFAANAGSAQGVGRDAPVLWARALGTLSLATLVTLAIGWAGASSVGEAFKIGALVGFLVWFGVDFIRYGNTNVWNLTNTVVDPVLEIIRTGVGGAVIGAVLGRSSASGPREEGQP
jgi:hypothetical protein